MKTFAWFLMGGLALTMSVRAQQVPLAQGADIIVENKDAANKGLNDPTKAKPVGGNYGKSMGEQRRIAYQFAGDLWAAVLQSPVPIHVRARFHPLDCNSAEPNGRDVLGQASTRHLLAVAKGLEGVRYHSALANAISEKDLLPGEDEIDSEFNSSMGGKNIKGADCMPGQSWYYGLDGKTPPKQVNFINIAMHEIGHGLGFAGFESAGRDIYSQFVYDNTSLMAWDNVLNRNDALTHENLTFHGPLVHAEVPLVLGPKFILRLTGNFAHDFERYGTAAFGPSVATNRFNATLAFANDGKGVDHFDACEPLDAHSLDGKVAFINRGLCEFEAKAKNAQDAGAVAMIVGNVPDSKDNTMAGGMSHGTNDAIRADIPSVQLNLADADLVRQAPVGAIRAQMFHVIGHYQGADDNDFPYLYAPPVYKPGSTFSHFDELALPNLLMEHSSKNDEAAHVNLDLTPALLADEGWKLNPGNGKIGACDTGVPAVVPGGKIVGANIQAYARSCLAAADGSRAKYLRCMTDHVTDLKNADLITNAQFVKVRACAAQVSP